MFVHLSALLQTRQKIGALRARHLRKKMMLASTAANPKRSFEHAGDGDRSTWLDDAEDDGDEFACFEEDGHFEDAHDAATQATGATQIKGGGDVQPKPEAKTLSW